MHAQHERIISDQTCWLVTSFISLIVILMGIMILIGWLLDFNNFIKIIPTWKSASIYTALCLILSGLCLWMLSGNNIHKHKRILIYFLATTIFFIGFTTHFEYIFHVNLTVDRLIYIGKELSSDFPGKMSLASATIFILLGISFILIDMKFLPPWMYQIVLCMVFPLALIGFFVHIFNVDVRYTKPQYFYMAFHSSIAFMLLCLGVFLIRPNIGLTNLLLIKTIGGRFVRRVIFLILILPELIIFIASQGVQNQYYDANFLEVILAVFFITIISLITYFNAYRINIDEQKIIEKNNQLEKNEKLFRNFSESSQDVFWQTTNNLDKIIYVSDAFETIWGLSKKMLYDNPNLWLESIIPEDRYKVKRAFTVEVYRDDKIMIEYRIKRPDGKVRNIFDRGYLLRNKQGFPIELIGVAIDMTNRWQQKYREEILSDMNKIFIYDTNLSNISKKPLQFLCQKFSWEIGEIWLLNPNTHALELLEQLNFSKENIVSLNISSICDFSLLEKIFIEKKLLWISDLKKVNKLTNGFKSLLGIPLMFRDTALGIIVFYSNKKHEPDEFILRVLEEICRQYAELIKYTKTQMVLEKLMEHDKVTGFLNYITFESEVTKITNDPKMKKGTLFILHIESYDLINQAFGHDAGVLLLQLISDRIKMNIVKDNDIVARLENNYIVIFNKILDTIEQINNHSKKIIEQFNEPYLLNGNNIHILVKIGISIYPNDATDIRTLFKYAQTALLQGKEDKMNQYYFYNKKLLNVSSEHLKMEIALRNAIEKQDFILHYQPQVSLRSNKIIGFEALIRWNDPKKGLISPNDFILLAEETDLIIPMTEWVLREVCQKISQSWFKSKSCDEQVAVNISAKLFKQSYDLHKTLDQLIKEFKIQPEAIELEITESLFLKNVENVIMVMNKIKEMGISFSIDDFGTGYSSLSYLLRIPCKKIKIDISFIKELLSNQLNKDVVNTIIALSHMHDKQVIAEGVETEEQMNFLKYLNCDAAQGYYFSKPLPADEIRNLIANNNK